MITPSLFPLQISTKIGRGNRSREKADRTRKMKKEQLEKRNTLFLKKRKALHEEQENMKKGGALDGEDEI